MADQFLPANFDQFINNFPVPIHPLQPFGLNIIDNPFPRLLDQSQGNSDSFNGLFIHDGSTLVPRILDNDSGDRKRKAMEIASPANSCPQGSEDGVGRKNCGRRGKRAKGNGEKEEKEREVIHVRARRGQATDSHSLAERVRRGKINERLRCLQEIVPGCYKTMGMAVMFDEIINYVQSLQNQVEFLSMKLTAVSTFHDFNSETDALETMQRAKAFEALKIQSHNVATAGPGVTSAQFAPLGLEFGLYPQWPHNK